MTRSLLRDSKIPSYLWGEVVRHSVYLLNRLPTKALKGRTPYEAWIGYKPNISHIKVFGCITYMKIPSVHTSKLDDRSKMVVYLGKEPGSNENRLYDPNSGMVHISRDTVFKEDSFWDWEQTNENSVVFPGSCDTAGNISINREDLQAPVHDQEPRMRLRCLVHLQVMRVQAQLQLTAHHPGISGCSVKFMMIRRKWRLQMSCYC